MLTLQNPTVFREALAQHALVLTPNHQLAVALHETHGRLCAERGEAPVQPTAPIMAVDIWLRQVWASLARSPTGQPTLLEPGQETFLWQHIIRNSSAGSGLLNLDAAAAAASEAWTLMQTHGLTRERFSAWLSGTTGAGRDDHQDLEVFLDWSERFEEHLVHHHYRTLAQCLETVVSGLEDGDPVMLAQLPGHSLRFGFEDPPPLYQRLLDQLAARTRHETLELHREAADIQGWRCNSRQQEMTMAAQWCQETLAREPDATIAVLIPELHGQRTTVERIFHHHIDPERISMPATRHLDSLPLISSALQLLGLNLEPLNVLEVCRTLRMPFLPREDPAPARAALEKHLRNEGELLLSSARLRFVCHQEGRDWHCPALAARLSDFHESVRRQSTHRLVAADAIPLILQQLESLGWPGEAWDRAGPSATTQAFTAWESLLDQLAEVCTLLGPLPYPEIIGLLQQLAGSTAVPGQRFGQLRLMTPAEAQFRQFDHVWFMGMDDNQWPGIPRLNPFLPLPLQRESGIAAEDQAAHVQWHEKLVRDHIARQCRQLQISFAALEEGQEQSPTAVFSTLLGSQVAQTAEAAEHALHPAIEAQRLETPDDLIESATEPALFPLDPAEKPRGGAAIIENQSCCPFRSFALHRLGSEELRDPEYGLNPMATGTMLHAAMDYLWGQLQRHDRLLAMAPGELETLVRDACEEAVRQTALRHPVLMQGRFRQLELSRLQSLLNDWLEQERQRPFAEVIAREQALTWQYGGLEIRLRLDRVEERLDGTLAIIDYKSGRRKSVKWTDPRPETPQLMLYLVAASEYYSGREISALLFAHINAHERIFNGLSLNSEDQPAIDFDRQVGNKTGLGWEEIRQQWRSSMEALADEFIAGECRVTPRNAGICQRCHLQAFCRIGDHSRLVGAGDEDPEQAP